MPCFNKKELYELAFMIYLFSEVLNLSIYGNHSLSNTYMGLTDVFTFRPGVKASMYFASISQSAIFSGCSVKVFISTR